MPEESNQTPAEEHITLPTRKKKNLTWLWILITAVVVGGGISAYAYRGAFKDKFWPKKEDASSGSSSSTSETTTPTSDKIVDEGVTWLNPRVKLADLGLFKAVTSDPDFPNAYQGTDYYKVGTTSDGGEIILAIAKVETLGTQDDFHHFKKLGGVYYWLSENSDTIAANGITAYARQNSQTDGTTVYKSLQLDKSVTTGSTVLTQDPGSSREDSFASGTTTGVKVGETKWGDMYLLQGKTLELSSNTAAVAQYYIFRNDGQRIIYHPEPTYRNDDGSFNVTWSGAGAANKYSQIKTGGCGGSGGSFPLITDSAALSSKTAVATKGSDTIYTIPAVSKLADFAYAVYTMDEMGSKASQATMIADMGVLLVKDGYDKWTIYMNDKYAPQAECGKPVIYLYPTKPEKVSVKVGATVTKSEPTYGNGWSVLANPSGLLSLGGKTYDSLYWEGTGIGSYPAITSGTVVETSRVAETITSQLKSIGLNDKEIADFNEFWLPKMPTTPYTWLTWLTNDEMNRLAPLAVTPKPDSVIRVFLDYAGQETSATSLAPQTLPHYERNGFTLVEWGGLLRK